MDLETILLLVRQVSCALIFLTLFSYRDKQARWKLRISIIASCVSGAALAALVFSTFFWHKELRAWYLPWLTVASVLVALRLIQTRGNMARAITIKRSTSNDTN